MPTTESPSCNEPMPKKREKSFLISLKRLLGRQQRAEDGAANLRPSPSVCATNSSGSTNILPACPADTSLSGRLYNPCVHSSRGPPRPSMSLPMLFPTVSSFSNAMPSLSSSQMQHLRNVATNSSSLLLMQLPTIDSCTTASSSGAMYDRYATPASSYHQQSTLPNGTPESSFLYPHQRHQRVPPYHPSTSALTSSRSGESLPLPQIKFAPQAMSSAAIAVPTTAASAAATWSASTASIASPVSVTAADTQYINVIGTSTTASAYASSTSSPSAGSAAAAAAANATVQTIPATPIITIPHPASPKDYASVTSPSDTVVDAGAAEMTADVASPSTVLVVCRSAPETMRRRVWQLADYNILARLYKGEVSSVYKAVCRLSGCRVVLKVYSLQRVAENALHTLVREVRIHSELDHEHVLALYGVFEEDNRLVLVLERAPRGDLFHLHRSLPNCRMTEEQLRVLVLAPLLKALVYLHGRGVCHRDIKPENLLMTSSWQLRLADFGAAIDLTQERAVTRTGTVDYMAPEVEVCPLKLLPEDNKDNPQLAYSTAADVWSVGVLAYEMLVGFPPFVHGRSEGPLGNPLGEEQASDSGAVPMRDLSFPHFVSAGGRDFISCALAERPMDRPTTAQLLKHPWLKYAVRQHNQDRKMGQQPQRL